MFRRSAVGLRIRGNGIPFIWLIFRSSLYRQVTNNLAREFMNNLLSRNQYAHKLAFFSLSKKNSKEQRWLNSIEQPLWFDGVGLTILIYILPTLIDETWCIFGDTKIISLGPARLLHILDLQIEWPDWMDQTVHIDRGRSLQCLKLISFIKLSFKRWIFGVSWILLLHHMMHPGSAYPLGVGFLATRGHIYYGQWAQHKLDRRSHSHYKIILSVDKKIICKEQISTVAQVIVYGDSHSRWI